MSISKTDLYFLNIAANQSEADPKKISSVSREQTGPRKKRGAVLVYNNKIISKGISQHLGGILYKPEADERYVATVTAEVVAFGEAVKAGFVNFANSTIYTSDCPNWYVYKFIIMLGIKRIVFYGPATNERIQHYSKELGVELLSIA